MTNTGFTRERFHREADKPFAKISVLALSRSCMRRFSGDSRERLGGVMHERLVANEGWVNAGRISLRTGGPQVQREGALVYLANQV